MAKKNKKVLVIDDLSKQFEEKIDATEVVFASDIDHWSNLPSWVLSNVEKITFRGEVSGLSHRELWGCKSLKELVFEKEDPVINEGTFFNCPNIRKLTFKEGISTQSYLPLSAFKSDANFNKIRIKIGVVTRTINEWSKVNPKLFRFYDLGLPSGKLWEATYQYVICGESNPVEPSLDDIYELLSYYKFESMSDHESDDNRLVGFGRQEGEIIFLHPCDCLRFITIISQSFKRDEEKPSLKTRAQTLSSDPLPITKIIHL